MTRTCQRCNVILPAAATNTLCDECDGAPPSPERPTAPKTYLVHDGVIAKRNGGLEDIGA